MRKTPTRIALIVVVALGPLTGCRSSCERIVYVDRFVPVFREVPVFIEKCPDMRSKDLAANPQFPNFRNLKALPDGTFEAPYQATENYTVENPVFDQGTQKWSSVQEQRTRTVDRIKSFGPTCSVGGGRFEPYSYRTIAEVTEVVREFLRTQVQGFSGSISVDQTPNKTTFFNMVRQTPVQVNPTGHPIPFVQVLDNIQVTRLADGKVGVTIGSIGILKKSGSVFVTNYPNLQCRGFLEKIHISLKGRQPS